MVKTPAAPVKPVGIYKNKKTGPALPSPVANFIKTNPDIVFGYLAGLEHQVEALAQESYEDVSEDEGLITATHLEDPFTANDQSMSDYPTTVEPYLLSTPSRPKWSDYPIRTNTSTFASPPPVRRAAPSTTASWSAPSTRTYSTAVSSHISTPASSSSSSFSSHPRFGGKGLFSTPTKSSATSVKSSSGSSIKENPEPVPLTEDKDLQVFIEPDLNITYSINHTTTNPDTRHRLATPYPAPKDILLASRQRYSHVVAEARRLEALGIEERKRRVPWTIFEDDQVIKYMLEIRLDESKKGEARFEEIARRMEADGLEPRSKTAIKNMWCRVGRGRSGYDERKGMRRDARFVVNKWKASEDSPRKRRNYTSREKKTTIMVEEVMDDGRHFTYEEEIVSEEE